MADFDRYVGDHGQVLSLTVSAIDLSAGATVKLFVRKPSQVRVEWTPLVVTPSGSSGGTVAHTFQVGDLDEEGTYEIEVEVVRSSPALQTTTDPYHLSVGARV